MAIEILYQVKAQRGKTLRCKGWKQESLLRMLENNMENGTYNRVWKGFYKGWSFMVVSENVHVIGKAIMPS